MSIRAFSYGGGVQSTAALVLAARREIDFPTFLFANVGDDSENPETISYVREIAVPWAQSHGIGVLEVKRGYRDGRGWTLYDKLLKSERSIDIPVRLEGSGSPARRSCTHSWKIEVIAKWLKQHGATTEHAATLGLGISLDEWQRMRTASGFGYYGIEYPLVDMRLDRANCEAIISGAGLQVPPKSSCYFSPFHTLQTWRDLKDRRPDLFEKAADLEEMLSERKEQLGGGKVYMTDAMVPLRQAVGEHRQLDLFTDDSACESGFCMT